MGKHLKRLPRLDLPDLMVSRSRAPLPLLTTRTIRSMASSQAKSAAASPDSSKSPGYGETEDTSVGAYGGGDQCSRRPRQPGTSAEQAAPEEEVETKGGEIRIHVTALDEVVSVNSFFTVAILIGLSRGNYGQSLVSKGASDPCNASSKDLQRQLVLFEVLAFSCFLMSSLVAQGLKLKLTICSATNRPACRDGSLVLSTHPRALRLGMLVTALGSIGGTVFLMLSIINVIQLRLGALTCDSVWSKAAAIPLVVLVSCGVAAFMSTVLIAFRS